MPGRARVVVVGAGFAGLTLVRALRGRPVEMVLVDRHNYHTFTPLLYQVASALLDPSEVAHPIRGIVRPIHNLEVRMAEATGVDLAGRRLLTDVEPLGYDFLVLCTGSTANYFGIKGLAGSAFGLKDLEQAMALRNQVLRRFEEASWTEDPERRRMLLTFAVVGGGPTGVEFSGALSELIRGVLDRDFPSVYIRETRILLVEAAPHLLGTFVPSLRESARRTLVRRGVEVLLDRQVSAAGEDHIELSDGERIDVGTVVWTAGVRAGDLAATLAAEHGRGGTVKVGSTLQLAGHPEVFVIGDLAAVEQNGAQLPQLIPPAMQEAKHVARTILGRWRARLRSPSATPTPASWRRSAATRAWPRSGRSGCRASPAGSSGWASTCSRSSPSGAKLVVLVNWAWNYFFLDRPVRLLVRAEGPGNEMRGKLD